jgi:hypothetical protein
MQKVQLYSRSLLATFLSWYIEYVVTFMNCLKYNAFLFWELIELLWLQLNLDLE